MPADPTERHVIGLPCTHVVDSFTGTRTTLTCPWCHRHFTAVREHGVIELTEVPA